jgi:hypothetical protein
MDKMMQNLENNLRKYKASWIALFCIFFFFILTIQLSEIIKKINYIELDNSGVESLLGEISENLNEIRKEYTDSYI